MRSLFGRPRSGFRYLAGALGALGALGGLACGGRSNGENSELREQADLHVDPELTLDLTPSIGQDAVEVAVRVVGPNATSVKELRIARAWAGTRGAEVLRDVEVSDARGPIDVGSPRDDGPDKVYPLSRAAASGALRVRYRAIGSADAAPSFALRVGGGRVSGVGHSFLLLPAIDAPMPARVRWHLGALGSGFAGASSFGVGEDITLTARAEDLSHAVYVAGRLATADSGAGERMTLLGNPELDVGAVLDWTVRVEGSMRRLFDERGGAVAAESPRDRGRAEPFTFVLVAEPRMGRDHDGAHLTRSLALWFDEARALDARLAIAIAHEILHRWIGVMLRFDDGGGRDAKWFSEGFTVHYARKLLFRERLISPEDFIADLRRALEPAAHEALGHHDAYSRGALYAAYLDAALIERSRGSRSLDDLLRELLAAASSAGQPRMQLASFRDLVVRELGSEGGDDFDRLIVRAEEPVELPKNAFGPCFQRARRKEKVFELGFDEASLRGDPSVIRGLVRGSAAERAGLRENDLVLAAKVPEERGQRSTPGKAREVELTVAGRRGGKKIRYKPVGERQVVRWEAQPCKR